jgi:alpha-L-fucosidase
MYDYSFTEWSAAKKGPKRDVIGELAQAVKGEGLVFGASSHRAGPQLRFGYKDFIPRFKAEKFDPGQWSKLFRDAGAKFIVPVGELPKAGTQ